MMTSFCFGAQKQYHVAHVFVVVSNYVDPLLDWRASICIYV